MSTTEVGGFPVAVVLIPKANDAAVAFAKSVVAAMTGSDDFKPAPAELTTLATDTTAYDEANVAARGGGRAATKALLAARRKVVRDLNHVCDCVQAVAESKPTPEDAAACIAGAGLRVKRVTRRNKPPVRAGYGPNSGSVWLYLLRVAPVAMYFWQFSLDQKSWTDAPETMKAKLLVTGLTPGLVYYFRFRAHTRKGPVDYSQVVSLMVH